MKYFRILCQIGMLYVIFLIGQWITHFLKLPIPGSITGLLLLFFCLYFNVIPENFIKEGAGFMLALLPLFLIPATVGVMNYPEFLSFQGILLLTIVIVSTLITMVVAGRTSQYYEEKTVLEEE